MKYALIIFSLLFSLQVNARHVESLSSSYAINQILSYLNDNVEEFHAVYRLSDKSFVIKDVSKCSQVSAKDVALEVKKSFDKILLKFPDEELPFNEAFIDLKDFLDNQNYLRCANSSVNSRNELVQSIFYISQNDIHNQIHLRMDNVAPKFE
jgi:hypothetical protein